MATVQAALVTALVRFASGKQATIGKSLIGFFPVFAIESRKSVTPLFSQLPRSTTAGTFFPKEESRADNPFPTWASRCFGFSKPNLARPTLAHPSETQKTSFFNNSRAIETIS